MARPLQEYFSSVTASDIADYGYGDIQDFLKRDHGSFDWVITNPPFNLAEAFIENGLRLSSRGVAMLVRTSFLETIGRYERLFNVTPPDIVAIFSERVPMVKGRLDRKASTATSYAWLVWLKNSRGELTELQWIPPCRKRLERNSDYEVGA